MTAEKQERVMLLEKTIVPIVGADGVARHSKGRVVYEAEADKQSHGSEWVSFTHAAIQSHMGAMPAGAVRTSVHLSHDFASHRITADWTDEVLRVSAAPPGDEPDQPIIVGD